MLLAVHYYTGKEIDIIAHSMGSPVSRKAILGGSCFDTGESVGSNLTLIVRSTTFVLLLELSYLAWPSSQ